MKYAHDHVCTLEFDVSSPSLKFIILNLYLPVQNIDVQGKISGSYSDKYEDGCLLGCCIM
jgi:hypothetical protein